MNHTLRILVASTAVLVAFLTVSAPPAAQAGCGGVQTEQPVHWTGTYRPPLAIGDSTMLLAMPNLARAGFAVDAHGCRDFAEGLALLQRLRSAGSLPHLVVVALGADGTVTPGDVQRTLAILGPTRMLALVTPRELGGGSGSDAQVVRREGRLHPHQIDVLDWVAYSSGRSGWFQPDGLHLTFSGAAAFARLIARALPLAAPGPPPLPRCPVPRPGPAVALAGVALSVPGGVLDTSPPSPRVALTATNANAFPLAGMARLVAFDPGHPRRQGRLLAAACVRLPPAASATVGLDLYPEAAADLQLRQRFPVRLQLSLAGPPGVEGVVGGVYLLERPRRHA